MPINLTHPHIPCRQPHLSAWSCKTLSFSMLNTASGNTKHSLLHAQKRPFRKQPYDHAFLLVSQSFPTKISAMLLTYFSALSFCLKLSSCCHFAVFLKFAEKSIFYHKMRIFCIILVNLRLFFTKQGG